MKIETLDEWNTILAGCECCAMPAFTYLKMCHRRVKGYSETEGKKSWNVKIEGLEDWVQGHSLSFEGITTDVHTASSPTPGVDRSLVYEYPEDTVDPDPPTPPGNFWVAYDDDVVPVTPEEVEARLDARLYGVSMSSVPVECEHTAGNYGPAGENGVSGSRVYKARSWYCWRLPVTFPGAYSKITWDVVTFPDDQSARNSTADLTYLYWYFAHVQYETYAASHRKWQAAMSSYAQLHAEWVLRKSASDVWLARTVAMDAWLAAKALSEAWRVTSGTPQPPAPGPKPTEPGDHQWPGMEPMDPTSAEPWLPDQPPAYVGAGPTVETLTTIWTGPGNPADEYDESWRTNWFVLDPPATPGTKRIVNIRVEHFRSATMGSKPQLSGEGYSP